VPTVCLPPPYCCNIAGVRAVGVRLHQIHTAGSILLNISQYLDDCHWIYQVSGCVENYTVAGVANETFNQSQTVCYLLPIAYCHLTPSACSCSCSSCVRPIIDHSLITLLVPGHVIGYVCCCYYVFTTVLVCGFCAHS